MCAALMDYIGEFQTFALDICVIDMIIKSDGK
jgi:hypothetical protein